MSERRAVTPLTAEEEAELRGWADHHRVRMVPLVYVDRLLATLDAARSSPAPAGLDAAWAEAEAALPEGWVLRLTKHLRGYVATAQPGKTRLGYPEAGAERPTAAAALHALTRAFASPPVDRDAP